MMTIDDLLQELKQIKCTYGNIDINIAHRDTEWGDIKSQSPIVHLTCKKHYDDKEELIGDSSNGYLYDGYDNYCNDKRLAELPAEEIIAIFDIK